MLSLLLLLNLLISQEKPWFEHYDDGVKALEERRYSVAISELEAAVSQRPDAKKKAKTYGVQFIEYYPYLHLTRAYINLGDIVNARKNLQLAKNQETAEDAELDRNLQILEDSINGLESLAADKNNGPDLNPIWLAVGKNDVGKALNLLVNLEKEYPDDAAIQILGRMLRDLQESRQELKRIDQAQEEARRKIARLKKDAEVREQNGDLLGALSLYQTIKTINPDDLPAAAAFNRIYNQLREEGRSKTDLDASLRESEQKLSELVDQVNSLTSDKSRLLSRNQSLERTLSGLRNADTPPPLYEVEALWNVEPLENNTYKARIALKLEANQPMRWVRLYFNDELVQERTSLDQTSYSLPVIPIYEFKKRNNRLEVVIGFDDEVEKSDRYPLVFPQPNKTDWALFGRITLACLLALAFGVYFIRKRKTIRAFRSRFNPYIAGAPVLNQEMFYGRRQLLKQILNTLHNNSLMIYGERRIGKTTFLHQLYTVLPHLPDETYQFIPVQIDLQGVKEDHFFSTLDHEIHAKLESLGFDETYDGDAPDHREFTKRLRKYIHFLKQTCEKTPKLVLLLDEVDVMNGFSEHTNQQLRSVFMRSFAKHLVAIMAGIHINTTWKSEGSPWYNFFEQIELKPFSQDQAKDLITEPVKGVYQYSKEAVTKIIELTDGKPYLIQKICVNLIAYVLTENRRRITQKDVEYVYKEISHEVQSPT